MNKGYRNIEEYLELIAEKEFYYKKFKGWGIKPNQIFKAVQNIKEMNVRNKWPLDLDLPVIVAPRDYFNFPVEEGYKKIATHEETYYWQTNAHHSGGRCWSGPEYTTSDVEIIRITLPKSKYWEAVEGFHGCYWGVIETYKEEAIQYAKYSKNEMLKRIEKARIKNQASWQ